MENSITAQGLCMNCKHAASCLRPSHSDTPIFYCGEHEVISTNSHTGSARHLLQPESVSPEKSRRPDSEIIKGLCTNCTNQNFCGLVRPDSGVWHCEEYR